MDLVSLSQVKQYLGITNDNSDGVLTTLISAYSAAARSFMNRDIEATDYTGEMYDGTGAQRMVLNNGPINSVASLSILPCYTNASPRVIDVTQLRLSGYMVTWPQGRFEEGLSNILISYNAGYAEVPDDIAQAVCEWVSVRFRTAEHVDYVSKGLAGETVTYLVKDMPDTVKLVFKQYRRVFYQ